ncbi:hypothetical protein [Planctomycetes bacterium K23_9]|uniref:hypothetical protein n=1 Tax=Stieleria marina TaxID=1930275 RepID=UPI0011A76599
MLFTSLIIVAVVTASLSLSTSSTRSELDRINRQSALRLAESELHRIATVLSTDDQWRDSHSNSVYSDWLSLATLSGSTDTGVVSSDRGNARVRYQLFDVDGDLANDAQDEVVVTAHARVGRSHVAVTATLQNAYPPLPILDYSVTTTDDLEIDSPGTLSTNGIVQVADDCKTGTVGVLVAPELQCSGLNLLSVRGDIASADVQLPSHDVVDVYAQAATTIPTNAIPQNAGVLQLQDILLSSNTNPYGAVDATGLYRINAQGNVLRISHCRIDATLVVEDCPRIDLSGGLTWSFPQQADAILVTDGTIRLQNVEPVLDESARGINFNPASTPYRGTSSNSNQTDSFPSELRGIIYAQNHIECDALTDNSRLNITGALICRDLRIYGNVSITSLPELIDWPPVAFADWRPKRFVRGSFRRVATP